MATRNQTENSVRVCLAVQLSANPSTSILASCRSFIGDNLNVYSADFFPFLLSLATIDPF